MILEKLYIVVEMATIDDVYKEVLEQAENFKKYAQ